MRTEEACTSQLMQRNTFRRVITSLCYDDANLKLDYFNSLFIGMSAANFVELHHVHTRSYESSSLQLLSNYTSYRFRSASPNKITLYGHIKSAEQRTEIRHRGGSRVSDGMVRFPSLPFPSFPIPPLPSPPLSPALPSLRSRPP